MEQDSDWAVRGKAAESLGEVEVKDDHVVSVLIQCLQKDEHWVIRKISAELLGKVEGKGEQVIHALTQCLQSEGNM